MMVTWWSWRSCSRLAHSLFALPLFPPVLVAVERACLCRGVERFETVAVPATAALVQRRRSETVTEEAACDLHVPAEDRQVERRHVGDVVVDAGLATCGEGWGWGN